jgi:hypothetical protein
MNTGPAAARNPRAWAAPPGGPPITGPVQLDTLPPDYRWYPLMLEIGRRACREEGLELAVAWNDDSGPREERLLEIRPLQR